MDQGERAIPEDIDVVAGIMFGFATSFGVILAVLGLVSGVAAYIRMKEDCCSGWLPVPILCVFGPAKVFSGALIAFWGISGFWSIYDSDGSSLFLLGYLAPNLFYIGFATFYGVRYVKRSLCQKDGDRIV